jgi:hypothetical protein
MKYILMMHAGQGPYPLWSWEKKDLEAHLAYWKDLNRDLKAAGEFVQVEALVAPDQEVVIRAASNGAPQTDGIFPESKEFLAGFWIIDVENRERAHAIAARASAAPGPNGVPLNMPIAVRQVMSRPPDEMP